MFRWFEESLGVSEEEFRAKVYMAAVARCFPGKAPGGGDRRPDAEEIVRCKPYLVRETEILAPKLVLAVGTLAIDQVLGTKEKLTDLIGSVRKATYHGVPTDVVALPHPSGASPWHRIEPGKTLLKKALEQIAKHPETKRTFGKG
jgi:uracil-DNA glycosylase